MGQCLSPNAKVSHSCPHVVNAKYIRLVRAIVGLQILESFTLHRYLIMFTNLLTFKDIPILRVYLINKSKKFSKKKLNFITDTPCTVFEDPSIATHQWCHFFGITMASIGSRILSSDRLNMYRNTLSGDWNVKSFTKGQPCWFKLARVKSTNVRPLWLYVRLNNCNLSNLIFHRRSSKNDPGKMITIFCPLWWGSVTIKKTQWIYHTKVWG